MSKCKYLLLSLLSMIVFHYMAFANVSLFKEPEDGKQLLVNAISNANKSVDLVMYYLSDTDLIHALENKSDSGYPVRVVLQQAVWSGKLRENNVGYSPSSIKTQLEHHHVDVQWGNPIFSYTHEKCLVIDHGESDQKAYIMTLNWSSSAFTSNREYGIIDTNSDDINEIEKVINADWARSTPEVTQPNLLWAPNNAREKMIALMEKARSTLYLEGELMDDDAIETELTKLSRVRHVTVKLIVPTPEDDGKKAILNDLVRSGVKIKISDINANPQTLYMHAKMFLVDPPDENGMNIIANSSSYAYVGSVNYLTDSLDNERELGIKLSSNISDENTVIRQLNTSFDYDWTHSDDFIADPVSNNSDNSRDNTGVYVLGASVAGVAGLIGYRLLS